jgi:eukaryotic-like serine/threonine-protein kinase
MSKLSTNSKTDIIVHIGIILSAFLIFFFAFFFVYLPWSTNHGEAITVPNLKGKSIEEAENILDDLDLDYIVSDCTFVAGANPLSVHSQYPKAMSNVKSDRKIYLTIITQNAPLVKLPDLLGRSVGSAKNQLLSVGLIAGETELIPALEENTVLKIKFNGNEINPGQVIPKGSKITFVVGDGYGNQTIDVPEVSGLNLEEAEILINGLELSLGTVIYENSDQPEGTVLRQKPAYGEGNKLKIGQSINVWVSGNAPSTQDPE